MSFSHHIAPHDNISSAISTFSAFLFLKCLEEYCNNYLPFSYVSSDREIVRVL